MIEHSLCDRKVKLCYGLLIVHFSQRDNFLNRKFVDSDYKILFDLCLKHSDKLIIILTSDFVIQHINAKTQHILNWTEKEVLNKKIDVAFQPIESSPFIIQDNSLTIHRNRTVLSWNGHSSTIAWEIIPTPLEKILFITGQENTNINYLNAQHLENILKYTPGFFYWKDVNSVYLGCNDEFAILAGLTSRHEVVGKTDYDLIWKERAALYVATDGKVIESGVARLEHVEEITISNQKTITAITNKVPMKDNQGNVVGLMGITIDITHQKEIEKALAIARKKAEDANQAKDEFIRNMSHDIRTPLSGIIGMSSILEKETLTPEQQEHAHMINTSGEQLLTLLNSVLDIIASGKQSENQVIKSAVDIQKLIQNITDLELPTIKFKNLELKVNLAEDLPKIIETDAIKIHRILLNLLGNAVKFTEQGYIEIGAKTKKTNRIEFYIRDTGPGIEEENRKNIFKKFFRGTSSSQGLYSGHGVGLHIVKRYIQLLHGTIAVESKPNEGTTFIVSIPAKVIKQACTPATLALSTKTASNTGNSFVSGIKILLIEDNPIALKTAGNILNQMGIGYEPAPNGAKAIELFSTKRFDLVLSDIGLPDISGIEVTRQLRFLEKKHAQNPIPIIGLTAHSVFETEQKALEAGMNKVLSKPIRPEHVTEMISQYNLKPSDDTNNSNSLESCTQTTSRHGLPLKDDDLFQLEHFAVFDEELGVKNSGGLETLQELLEMLVHSELPSDQKKMQDAFEEGNYSEVERLAHKIKGGAIYTGTTRMKFACQYVERYWKSGDRRLFERLYHQANKVIDETITVVAQWLK